MTSDTNAPRTDHDHLLLNELRTRHEVASCPSCGKKWPVHIQPVGHKTINHLRFYSIR